MWFILLYSQDCFSNIKNIVLYFALVEDGHVAAKAIESNTHAEKTGADWV